MARVVQKFGGSSLSSTQAIQYVADKIIQSRNTGLEVVVVVSAMGKETERLLSLAHAISQTPGERELALLLSCGEQVSASLVAMALIQRGAKARAMTGREAGIQTSSHYYRSQITGVDPQAIIATLARGEIPVVCGFQGMNEQEEITILERGGSDATAIALAFATKAAECQIFTDVKGVYTADPHLLPEARCLPSVSIDNMLAMAQHGARVLQAHAVELAARYQVPVRVLSTGEEGEGTSVTFTPDCAPLCSIAVANSQPETGQFATVSLIGTEIASYPALLYKMAKVLNNANIKVHDTRISPFALSAFIDQNDVFSAVRNLHTAFLLTEEIRVSNFGQLEETKLCETN